MAAAIYCQRRARAPASTLTLTSEHALHRLIPLHVQHFLRIGTTLARAPGNRGYNQVPFDHANDRSPGPCRKLLALGADESDRITGHSGCTGPSQTPRHTTFGAPDRRSGQKNFLAVFCLFRRKFPHSASIGFFSACQRLAAANSQASATDSFVTHGFQVMANVNAPCR